MKNTYTQIFLYILIVLFGYTSYVYAESPTTFHVDKSFRIVPDEKNANKKVVLITIDDGPSKNSGAFVDVLKKHNAYAIFFINGMHNNANKDAIKKEYDAGHAIGNHTWSHINIKKTQWSKVQKEIDTNTQLIQKITGKNPRFFRPPYGVSTLQARSYTEKNGMIFMNWSGTVADWEKTAHKKEVYISNVITTIHDGEIILLHEHDWSVEYFDALLSTLEKDGYSFVNPNTIH